MLPWALGPHPVVVTVRLGAKEITALTTLLPSLCQSPLLLPTWSLPAPDLWRYGKGLDPRSAACPTRLRSRLRFKSQLCHGFTVGLPRNYHRKLPTFPLSVTEQ